MKSIRMLLACLAVLGAAGASAQTDVRPRDADLRVVMYSTSWCSYCAKARAYFARSGIAYVEHDIDKSASAHAEFKRLGGRLVPLIVVGREKMDGFSEQGFEHLLARVSR